MDDDPFLEFDLFDIQPSLGAELEQFTKSHFDLDKALAAARNLKDSKTIQQFLTGQLESPSEDFVSYVAGAVDIDINTEEERRRITEIIQQTLKTFKGGETDSPSPDPESDEGGETDDPSPSTGDLDSYKVIGPDETWIGKTIRAFTFNGERREVKYWSEFLTEFCKILSDDDTNQFEDVLELKLHYLSKNPAADFAKGANPKLIGSTGIYVQTHIDNDVKKVIVIDLVKRFGCNMPVLYIDEN